MRYLLLLLSLLASQPLYAGTLGAVTGIVADSAGGPVVGAEIFIGPGTGPGKQVGVTTAPEGRFIISGLPAGAIAISISTTVTNVELKIETTVFADSTFDIGTIRLGVAVQRGLKGSGSVNGHVFVDAVMIGAAGAWNVFGGRSGGIFVPSIGYELDYWIWSLAPSLRLAGHYSGISPFYSLQLELRSY